MATETTERPTGHYRAYTPRPFTRAERDSVTILFGGLISGPTAEETAGVEAGYRVLTEFNARLRRKGREVLEWCARESRGCLMVLARPYHMDPGIGHEIEVDALAPHRISLVLLL